MVLTFSLSLYILSESGEMSLPCMILINLRTSYLVSVMACGTVAVMFRLVSEFRGLLGPPSQLPFKEGLN